MERVSRHSGKRGFTLIEFLFVAFTLALFLTALFNITQGGLRAYQRGVVQTELKHELRNIVDRVTTDVRQAVPGSFTVPARTSSLDMAQGLQFWRHKYAGDNMVPESNTQVTYQLSDIRMIPRADGGHYYIGSFNRSEMTPSLTTSQSLTDYMVRDYQIGLIKVLRIGVNFYWDFDPLATAPVQQNIDLLRGNIMIIRTHAGSTEPEVIDSSIMIALRPDKDIVAGSNYYPPTTTDDPYANIQRFGSPTSLIRP